MLDILSVHPKLKIYENFIMKFFKTWQMTVFFFSIQAVSYSQSALQGKILHGRVALSVQSSQTMWLDPAEERVTLTGV